jgi:hypothetical protein
MKKSFLRKLLGIISLLFLLVSGGTALADFTWQTKWPPSPMGTDIWSKTSPNLAEAIKYLYEWGIGLGGVAVFIALIIAGFEYITSIGNPSKMQDAFNRIRDAVIGLVILLASYAMLSIIGINLSAMKIDMFDVTPDAPTTECSSEKDLPAPDCCLDANKKNRITDCDDSYYTCIGASGNKKGVCQPNMNKTECDHIVVNYANNTSETLNASDADIQKKIPLNTTILSMEPYSKDGPCYDPTSDDKKFNDTKNKACDCGLQVFTKSLTVTGGTISQDCENADEKIVNTNAALLIYIKAKNVVCVSLKKLPKAF